MKILLPLSWIYGGIMACRNWMFDHELLKQTKFSIPTISVGNLAVGGTGKTPHTEYILNLLTHEGRNCAMLSRGYGRKTKGFYEAKGKSPQTIGDEPWQVQKKYPEVRVCVCESRVTGINKILERKNLPDVIILDDAYQHRYVKPGLSVLLTDYARPYYSDHVMPAGRLREFKSGSDRADIILVTKCPQELSPEEQQDMLLHLAPLPHQEVFFTRFEYGRLYAYGNGTHDEESTEIKQEKVLLLCGIARPENLIAYLKSQYKHLDIAAFPDHHNFSPSEIEQLGKQALQYKRVITTEKDAARLSGYQLPPSLENRLWVQPIEVKFINQASNKFNNIISSYVTKNSRNCKVD